jgi:hypothetical protein
VGVDVHRRAEGRCSACGGEIDECGGCDAMLCPECDRDHVCDDDLYDADELGLDPEEDSWR